jgi:hypothetical protein
VSSFFVSLSFRPCLSSMNLKLEKILIVRRSDEKEVAGCF